jgi:hypothetical protein
LKEETSGQTGSKDELVYWRHVGKGFGIKMQAWLSPGALECACQFKHPEDQDPEVQHIIEYLKESGVGQKVWTMGRFQTQV